jgi:3-phenylpropionate/trans-cinnamate dioxygenase ferredoxin subunit
MASQTYIPIVPLADVPDNGSTAVSAFGRSILICKSHGNVYAVANECSHQQQPLAGGRVRGTFLFCPVHGARYDLRTGMPSGTLTQQAIRTYAARVHGDWIEISESASG